MKQPIADSKAVEILENLDKGNTVIFMIAGVTTKKGYYSGSSGVLFKMKAGFLACNENQIGGAYPLPELFEQILQHVMDTVQPNFKEVIENLTYTAICYDHNLSDKELKQIRSKVGKEPINNPANRN
jgi:hypothetical protein